LRLQLARELGREKPRVDDGADTTLQDARLFRYRAEAAALQQEEVTRRSGFNIDTGHQVKYWAT